MGSTAKIRLTVEVDLAVLAELKAMLADESASRAERFGPALDYAITQLRALPLMAAKARCWDSLMKAERENCACEIGPGAEHEHGCKSEVAYDMHQDDVDALQLLEGAK